MAWEDLLKLHKGKETELPVQRTPDTRDMGSLLRQVSEMVGQNDEAAVRLEAVDTAQEYVRCGDGYVRRSPVQPYQTAPDYRSRRIRKAVMIVLGICLAALVVVALIRAGLLRLR